MVEIVFVVFLLRFVQFGESYIPITSYFRIQSPFWSLKVNTEKGSVYNHLYKFEVFNI